VIKHYPSLTDREIVVSDISPAMLRIAQRRAGSSLSQRNFQVLDAHALAEIADESFDLYSISLALKICDRERALREAYRVLKPGGRLIALEASAIVVPWMHRLYLVYMNICMPVIGWIATGGDASAYRYLLKGVEEFPDAERLAQEMRALGFVDVTFERMTLGIVAIHTARKPRA
jgi:demethylmenaquinone methyltransferase / 2-methoxy-6-polyprenyl-1,4-benzoquinol methylase